MKKLINAFDKLLKTPPQLLSLVIILLLLINIILTIALRPKTINIDKLFDDVEESFEENIENSVFDNSSSVNFETEEAEEKLPTKEMLRKIRGEFITQSWNDGFCTISHYSYDGKGSTGEELDLEYTLHRLDRIMGKRDEYNAYVTNLEGEEYEEIKYIWGKLIGEIDRMYIQIKTETPRGDGTYDFDTGNFSDYSDDLDDEIRNLSD